MLAIEKLKRFTRFGVLALTLVLALAACDLTGTDVGIVDGMDPAVSDLGIVWSDDEFELTGTVSELGEQPGAMTVSYPTDEGTETVLVTVPENMLMPTLNQGDLVFIRGERDASGVLVAREIDRIGPQSGVPAGEP